MPVTLSLLTAGHCAKSFIIFFLNLTKKNFKNQKNIIKIDKKYQIDVDKQSDVVYFFLFFSPADKCNTFSIKCKQ